MELTSATAYLQIAAFFSDRNLVGMSAWMRAQASEERAHADRFFDFCPRSWQPGAHRGDTGAGGRIRRGRTGVRGRPGSGAGRDRGIHTLYRLASDFGDLASFPFLQAFIAEQNEEESTVQTILDRLRLASGDSGAIFLLDHELGARGDSEA